MRGLGCFKTRSAELAVQLVPVGRRVSDLYRRAGNLESAAARDRALASAHRGGAGPSPTQADDTGLAACRRSLEARNQKSLA